MQALKYMYIKTQYLVKSKTPISFCDIFRLYLLFNLSTLIFTFSQCCCDDFKKYQSNLSREN